MADKLMYIPPNDYKYQHYPFCRLKLLVETFVHSTIWTNNQKINESPKVTKPANYKTFL